MGCWECEGEAGHAQDDFIKRLIIALRTSDHIIHGMAISGTRAEDSPHFPKESYKRVTSALKEAEDWM